MDFRQIGLTGGIGSGKTTVAGLLIKSGYPVYFADERAKVILDTDSEVKEKVKNLLGESVFQKDGTADRKKIASLVFSNPELLKGLNAIIHPATFSDFEKWKMNLKSNSWVFKEAAILLEAGADQNLDAVLLIQAPLPLRLQRVCDRDQTTAEKVLERMAQQWPEEKKVNKADFIIYNDGMHPLEPQIEQAIEFFKQKFG